MTTLKIYLHNSVTGLIVLAVWAYAISFNNATGWALAMSVTGIVILSLLMLLTQPRHLPVQANLVTKADQQRLQLTCRLTAWQTTVTPYLRTPALPLYATGRGVWETQANLSRGIYSQVIIDWRLTDPLHLFVKRRTQQLTTTLIVPPALATTAANQLFDQLTPLLHTANPVSSTTLGFEAQDFRPYQPGDPSNQIDWKLSAKQPTPMLRVLANDEPVPWGWVFFATTTTDLEAHLAAFYTFVQLVSELPADILLIGTTQQMGSRLVPDAFASYQPYVATTSPTTTLQQHRVVLFGDDSPLTAQLLAQLKQQNVQATTINWSDQRGPAHA